MSGCARFGIKQCERLGFITVGTGVRRANTFRLVDGWRTVDAVEAKRQVQLAKLPKPPKPPQVAAPQPLKRRSRRSPHRHRSRWSSNHARCSNVG